jgi:hypothetical protein
MIKSLVDHRHAFTAKLLVVRTTPVTLSFRGRSNQVIVVASVLAESEWAEHSEAIDVSDRFRTILLIELPEPDLCMLLFLSLSFSNSSTLRLLPLPFYRRNIHIHTHTHTHTCSDRGSHALRVCQCAQNRVFANFHRVFKDVKVLQAPPDSSETS